MIDKIKNYFIKPKKSSEEVFWNWVIKHKSDLEHFIKNPTDYHIYTQLTSQLQKYNSQIFPEMTIDETGNVELILTADGIISGIEPIQKLYDTKPELNGWIIKKFRQPTDYTRLNFNGVEYGLDSIELIPNLTSDNEKFDIQVFIKNMNLDPNNYQTLGFLYLDHILGEFNTMTRIGTIEFYHLEEDQKVKNGISILELRKKIETEIYLN